VGPVVLDDDLGLLREGVRVERGVPGGCGRGLGALNLDVCTSDRQAVVGLVGRVAREHVEDVALLDGLTHRVQVERAEQRAAVLTCLGRLPTEQLEGLRLGCRGEREHRHVRLPAPGGRGPLDGVVHVVLAGAGQVDRVRFGGEIKQPLVAARPLGRNDLLHLLRRLTGLR
jgi:hypothetical protein